ncbi:hypothetical protein [Duganella sp. CF517]|uniref:hypothetical protein n=1 Tax=Duganella sp. CF517 TaxID=1881038 RepID=UPI001E2E8C5E|nr:hypothetical protein [Duganella sp. CF517]
MSLPGTLRLRFTDLDALMPNGDIGAVLAGIPQPVAIDVAVFQLVGTLSVPLLTGARAVPVAGVGLATAAGPIGYVLDGTDPARPLRLLFNNLEVQDIAGGLVWRAGQLGQQIFSLLGTQLPFGLQGDAAALDEAAPRGEPA